MRLRSRPKRGFMMLGMAAIIFISVLVCGALLESSLECYRASAMGEWRLQARLAAEGAVVLLKKKSESEREEDRIGVCVVRYQPPQISHGEIAIPVTVDVRGKADQTVFASEYVARFGRAESGAVKFLGLEKAS